MTDTTEAKEDIVLQSSATYQAAEHSRKTQKFTQTSYSERRKIMYKVQHTVFKKYVDVDWFDTYDEALKKAHDLNNDGWLNIRIITPDNQTIQVHGE